MLIVTLAFIGLVACANEASEFFGDMLVDAGNVLRDSGISEADAQPLHWERVHCVAEPPYTAWAIPLAIGEPPSALRLAGSLRVGVLGGEHDFSS